MDQPPPLLRHVRRLAGRDEGDDVLLALWVDRRDQEAFAALVHRHAAMVSRVCRSVLGDAHAADDAAQAAFLVLARKAPSVRPAASLPAWLHGVARRVALKARAIDARRPRAELPPGGTPSGPDPLGELSAKELVALLDEEVARLPSAYRLPVVLCCLEGRTQEEAAELLGWSAGSVRGRLERGRARLRDRLAKRGADLSAGLSAVEAWGALGKAASERLAEAAAGVVFEASASGRTSTLAATVIREMFMTRIKWVAWAVLSVGLLGGAVALPGILAQSKAKDPAARGKTEDTATKEAKMLQGVWKVLAVEANGEKAPEATLKDFTWTFQDDEMHMADPGGAKGKNTFKLDPTKKLKEIDIIAKSGASAGNKIQGIYKLEDGKLTVCLRHHKAAEKGRPTEFAGGATLGLYTMERVKKE